MFCKKETLTLGATLLVVDPPKVHALLDERLHDNVFDGVGDGFVHHGEGHDRLCRGVQAERFAQRREHVIVVAKNKWRGMKRPRPKRPVSIPDAVVIVNVGRQMEALALKKYKIAYKIRRKKKPKPARPNLQHAERVRHKREEGRVKSEATPVKITKNK